MALKPPRGFDFSLTVGNSTIDASELAFCPMDEIPSGFQLLACNSIVASLVQSDDAEELAWLIVESGVGEEVAARIQHVEFASIESAATRIPIARLAEYA